MYQLPIWIDIQLEGEQQNWRQTDRQPHSQFPYLSLHKSQRPLSFPLYQAMFVRRLNLIYIHEFAPNFDKHYWLSHCHRAGEFVPISLYNWIRGLKLSVLTTRCARRGLGFLTNRDLFQETQPRKEGLVRWCCPSFAAVPISDYIPVNHSFQFNKVSYWTQRRSHGHNHQRFVRDILIEIPITFEELDRSQHWPRYEDFSANLILCRYLNPLSILFIS